MYLWLTCKDTLIVLDWYNLRILQKINKNGQLNVVSVGDFTSLPLQIVDYGIQN